METKKKIENEWMMEGGKLPFQKSLYSTAYRFTGNPDTAEDLVQETYLKAFRYFGKFKKGTNFRAWLFRILKNSFINHYRKTASETIRIRSMEMGHEGIPSAPLLPDTSFPTEELGLDIDGEIREAMASLPEGYRRMVILKDLNHYSYDEIARLADIPLGTVMSRLFRGRKMLEKALLSYGLRQGYIRDPSIIKQRNKTVCAS